MIGLLLRSSFSTSLKQKLIQNSLAYVHKYGWNERAIHAACATLDLSPASHKLITPFGLIKHSMQNWNRNALRMVDDTNFDGRKRIRDKIAFGIRTRLQQEVSYIDSWHEAMRLGMLPENISTTKDLLWNFSDEVWRRCGDNSTDYNYYSKRILFNSAFAATELFMLTDQSSNRFATWQFLERRLDDIQNVGRGIADAKVVGQAVGNGILSLFSMFKKPEISNIITAQNSSQLFANCSLAYFQMMFDADFGGNFIILMYFYGESIEVILRKQKLSNYIESVLVNEKGKRKVMPSAKMVQVVTFNSVSDGVCDFPCKFITNDKPRKGSFLRLTKWEVDTHTYQLIIIEAQYLGGAGCEVHHGRPWDIDKMKHMINARVVSKHFVIFHDPMPDLTPEPLPEFNFSNLQRAIDSWKPIVSPNKEGQQALAKRKMVMKEVASPNNDKSEMENEDEEDRMLCRNIEQIAQKRVLEQMEAEQSQDERLIRSIKEKNIRASLVKRQ